MSEPNVVTADLTVEDNPEESRYEARLGDRILGIAEYELPDEAGPITFTHTEVLPDAEGQGVGTRLARGALDDVRARGLKLISDCPFMSAYLRRHQADYGDLVLRILPG
jgi:uncharacterized protein